MNELVRKIKNYLYNTDIDINERLSTFFINIGIVAAILGTILALLEHAPAIGTMSAALIAVGAPLITSLTRHMGHPERCGSLIAVMIIFMIPLVWLTTGGSSGGSDFWLLYELFYITLFTKDKQRARYYVPAILVQAAAIAAWMLYPEYFFHFTNRVDEHVSVIGTGALVTAEILITVLVQKAIYIHEREISTRKEDTTRNFVTSIANTIDTKDPYTGGHSRRVAECASAIALQLGMTGPEVDNLYFVALLHDIGKIGVPDRVLNKPGKLTDEEFSLIKKHPVYGAEILKDITTIPHVRDGVLYHHERYDGKGYPEGLKGEEIPFIARVISVADSYDAMSTNRIYRKSIKREEIINEMIRCRGTQFDPHIVDVFVEMLMKGFRIKNAERNDSEEEGNSLAVSSGELMRCIMKEKNTEQKSGTTLLDNNEFINLYTYLYSLSLRDGDQMLLMKISLDTNGVVVDEERFGDCMVDLNRAISKNIRAVDICTQYNENAFLILLLNASAQDVDNIVERVRKDFCSVQGNTGMTIRHSIVENSTLTGRENSGTPIDYERRRRKK